MKRWLLILFLLFVIFSTGIRYLGEQHLTVTPESIPNVVVNTDTPLYKEVQMLLADDPEQYGSLFYPLGDPHLALISRIKLMKKAVGHIDAQYYLFHDDKAGRAMLGAMVAAANRGVKVRLLLDDMDMSGRESLFAQLVESNSNIQVRVFNPVWYRSLRPIEFIARFPRVTRRMHNKALIVDNIASIAGGRNIGNEYFAVDTEVAFTDFDILASGAIAADVSAEFNQYWHSGIAVNASRLAGNADDMRYRQWLKQLDQALQNFHQDLIDYKDQILLKLADKTLKPYFSRGEVIYDQPEKVLTSLTDRSGHLGPKIIELMGSAQQSLLIASPYFIPGKTGMALFEDLRSRGVEVIILTNSLAANDVVAVHSGYIDYREDLLKLGVQLYEMKETHDKQALAFLGSKRASLHAKSFIVDQTRIYVGSFNLDPRSAIHNTEMGIVFDSQEYAVQVYAGLKDYLKRSAYDVSYNVNTQSLEWRETNDTGEIHVHQSEPSTSWILRTAVYLMSWLPVEWLL